MRPEVLYPLFKPLTALSGVGPRLATAFEGIAGTRIIDLLWHLPSGVIDRRYAPKIAEAESGRVATLTLRVGGHNAPHTKRQPYRVQCFDDTGQIDLVFFHAKPDYLKRVLPEGEVVVVSGTFEVYHERPQMTHPDHIGRLEDLKRLQTVEPVYPLTQGISLKVMNKVMAEALKAAPELPEWLDPAFRGKRQWSDWRAAMGAAHHPKSAADLAPCTPARQRLAYDELLANQLALALMRRGMRAKPGRAFKGDGRFREKVMAALPFELTGAQKQALEEIYADMAAPHRMLRLLQGDVGSGKTVVALFAMLEAVETGAQAALMAPTEILARQHYRTLAPLAEAAGLRCIILTGRDKGKTRKALLGEIESGTAHIVVGTHALFQEDVVFDDLGLAVIDEQHRFGVHQRMELAAKGKGVDLLVTTATPIPRTLMLTAYGDLETSRLREKPPGRIPTDTRTISQDRLQDVVAAVGRAVGQGAKVYWVCPLVADSEASDLAAAEGRHEHLKEVFGAESVGLVHGRMKSAEKDAVMEGFKNGPIKVLVATTVIEVGVDVPEASVMVIERAERFGLAQLHQLRGRIGRGAAKSTCLLVYRGPLGEVARRRLQVMRETEDGFRIAEEDLKLRGGGEILGTRQSGLPEFRVADLAVHDDLLAVARDDAKLILEKDGDLNGERGRALRVLLYLFELDSAVRYLGSA